MNPYDLYALETALRLKEEKGGRVTVITMGPPQATEIIKEAFAMGADEGYLLTDRKFAGADVLATSHALSQGILKCGEYDMIICGKQTTDGDTAQVGTEIAEWLDIPSLSNVTKIISAQEDSITVEMEMPTTIETSKIMFPCMISVDKDIFVPRLPSYLKLKASKDKEIHTLTMQDLDDKDENTYGLNGSPTQVQSIFPPEVKSDREIWYDEGNVASDIHNKLKELKFI
jgi:electron transfer flavoprotein beta subunit